MSVRTVVLAGALASATVALVAAATPPALTEALAGRQVFPNTNWWNLDISRAPLDPQSAAYINFISGPTGSNMTATRRLHPDFGPSPYGIPYVVVSGDQLTSPRLETAGHYRNLEPPAPAAWASSSRPRTRRATARSSACQRRPPGTSAQRCAVTSALTDLVKRYPSDPRVPFVTTARTALQNSRPARMMFALELARKVLDAYPASPAAAEARAIVQQVESARGRGGGGPRG